MIIETQAVLGGQVLGRRSRQEDAWDSGMSPAGPWAAVADGLGGHADGDRASQWALVALRAFIDRHPAPPGPLDLWMRDGVKAAHEAVRTLGRRNDPRPPATTLLWAVSQRDQLWMAHVGDCRATFIRGENAKPLTLDMTPAGERVWRHEAPWDSQNTAPDAHQLVSCLGIDPVTVEVFPVSWQSGDAVVLATDGLNPIPVGDWPAILATPDPVATALAQGPFADNATLVVLQHA